MEKEDDLDMIEHFCFTCLHLYNDDIINKECKRCGSFKIINSKENKKNGILDEDEISLAHYLWD